MVKKKDYIEPVSPTYSETQRFRQLWIWILITVPTVVTISSLTWSIFNTPSNKSTIILTTLICSIFLSSIIYLVYIATLDTKITAVGVFIKFRPGWGIRYGLKGKAYNVSGNMGVLIKFSDGTRLLIGSQTNLQLVSAINNHFH